MTNKQIIEKAIQQAQTAGCWDKYDIVSHKDMGWTMTAKHRKKALKDLKPGESYITAILSENDIIFNHDFAKSLWKDEYIDVFGLQPQMKEWAYHLTQMVLSKDPIKYLGEHLDN